MADEDRPIYTLTVQDFDCALEMALDTLAETEEDFDKEVLTSERRREILERVRKSVGWAEWTQDFAVFVRDEAYGVLVLGEDN